MSVILFVFLAVIIIYALIDSLLGDKLVPDITYEEMVRKTIAKHRNELAVNLIASNSLYKQIKGGKK